MHYNKIIMIGILLTCIPSVLAWDDEGGIGEDELFDIMFNQAYMHMDTDNPKWYDPIAAIDALLVSFTGYFTHTPPNLQVQVQIKKLIWDGRSSYFQFKANTSEEVAIPVYKHMKKVLNDNPDEYQGFKTVDEDIKLVVAVFIQVLTFIVGTVTGLRRGQVTFLNNSFIFVFLFYL
jgi:hypothetical protein